MTYLITFTCYGTHLHGHESGSVDRTRRLSGSRPIPPDPNRIRASERRMNQPPYTMDQARRTVVLSTIQDRCAANHWTLLAAHVRTNHVHIVLAADSPPARIMNDLKSYASRTLNSANLDEPTRTRWTRHGSTRWFWQPTSVQTAIRYVIDQQGEPMAAFEATPAE